MMILWCLIIVFTGTVAGMDDGGKQESPKRPQYLHDDVTQPYSSYDMKLVMRFIKKQCQKWRMTSSSAPKTKNKIKDD